MDQENTPPVQTVNTTQQISPNNNRMLIIIGIFLILIVGFGGFYLGAKSQQKKQMVEVTPAVVMPSKQMITNVPNTVIPTSLQNSSQSYTDPDNLYTLSIPNDWTIDKQWERGVNVQTGESYSRFQKNGEYMQLTIAKLYSHNPEYPCRPLGGNPSNLDSINFSGYQSYDAYSGFNLDDKNQSSTSYTYCVNVKGKNFQIYFVPTAAKNNPQGIMIFYDILKTLKFK